MGKIFEDGQIMTAKYTIKDFNAQFPDDDTCLEFLFQAGYPLGVTCPNSLKIANHYKRSSRKSYTCSLCGNDIFPTAGTIFHKSATPLRLWFYAMFLMSSTRCGISAKQLERELGVTYKTAWRMFKQIRSLMGEDTKPMNGNTEVDETYMGGKHHGKPGRGAEGKTPVVGLVNREASQVVTKVVTDVKSRTIMPIIWDNIPRAAQNSVHTDELASYNHVQN